MVRTLLKSVKQYKTVSILTPLVMIGEASMEIIIPFLMGFLIDEITAMAETTTFSMNIVWYGLAMIACAAFALFCGIMGGRLASKASAGFAANLRYDYQSVCLFQCRFDLGQRHGSAAGCRIGYRRYPDFRHICF